MTKIITISSNAAEVAAKLSASPKRMLSGIMRALDRENDLTVGHIQRAKLSSRGPTTLGVRTNRLRRSARPSKAVMDVNGVSSSIGSNVIYAGVHEYGIDAMVSVQAHKRRLIAFDRYEHRGSRLVKTQSGIRGAIKAHRRHMRLPARAMFRTGIEERLDNYSKSISAAIIAAWEGSQK